MKEIKVTDLKEETFDVAKNWDLLPIPRKIEIAKVAGVTGRLGSSTWENLHESDKEAILKLYISEEPLIEPIQISPRDKSFMETGRQIHEDITAALGVPSSAFPKAKRQSPLGMSDGKGHIYVKAGEDIKVGPVLEEALIKVQDYLLWVGWGSYPTIKSFIAEATTMGVSRRISKIPRDLVLGKSKIFLAHDEGETGDAVIFGYFTPTGIEMIVFDDTTIDNNLRKDITPITLEQASSEDERGCGQRSDVGATYLMSYASEDITIEEVLTEGEDILESRPAKIQPHPSIVILKPTKDYNAIIDMDGHRFRGIKKVDGQAILSGKTKKEPSLRHKVSKDQKMLRKKGDRWSDNEWELLRKLTSEMTPRRAFREMMKITGRSFPTMEWHYRKIRESER